MNKTAIVIIMLMLAACGGDGGGDNPLFAGVWNGYLDLVEDSCGTAPTNYAIFTHLVNQDGARIVVDNGLLTFTGTVQSDTSFSASTERPFAAFGSSSCTERLTFRYEAVDEQAGTASFVVRLSEIRCQEGSIRECRFAFTGSASRTGEPDSPRPIPETAQPGSPVNEAVL